MPDPKTIYLEIPLDEYEYLHAENVRLRKGWSDAEAQIAVLRDALDHCNSQLTVSRHHEAGWEQRALDAEAAVTTLQARLERVTKLWHEASGGGLDA